jgi:hypothetical protein
MLLASTEAVAGISAAAVLLGAAGGAAVSIITNHSRLDAEAGRQESALRHDRALADLADLRGLLDATAIALERGNGALGGVSFLTDERLTLTERRAQAKEIVALTGEVYDRLVESSARLGIRLEDSDPVHGALQSAKSAILVIQVLITSGKGSPERMQRLVEQFQGAQRLFLATAVRRVGSAVYPHVATESDFTDFTGA